MQLQLLGLVALAALASAQQTNSTTSSGNSTIYELLQKNAKSYQTTKFDSLLKSDPGYQPVIDLLSNPGNYTVFVPNDKAIDSFFKDYKSQAPKGTNTSALPKADATFNNVTIADILTYHVVNGSFNLSELNQTVNIFETGLNNETVYKLNGSAPLIVSTDVNCKTFFNPQWHQKNNVSIQWEVGNGDEDADIKKKDVKASNGNLNVIDEVLAPPSPPSMALKNEGDVSTIYKYLTTHQNISDLIDSGSNFTIFLPNNNAVRKANIDKMNSTQIEELVKNHIIKGVYYTTNFTEGTNVSSIAVGNSTSGNSSSSSSNSNSNSSLPVYNLTTITTANGYQMPISFDNCKFKLNNSATITDPNILLDNGVLHIIDRVFNATEPTANATEYDPFASVEPSASATDGTATATDSGAASATDSGAASATDSGAASATTA